MDLIGTSAAAVPAATTSENLSSSSYRICHVIRREVKLKKDTDLSLLDFPAKALTDFTHTFARDTFNHILTVWYNKSNIFSIFQNSDKARCRKLINLCPSLAVQMQ